MFMENVHYLLTPFSMNFIFKLFNVYLFVRENSHLLIFPPQMPTMTETRPDGSRELQVLFTSLNW